jgi:hypothetical protein
MKIIYDSSLCFSVTIMQKKNLDILENKSSISVENSCLKYIHTQTEISILNPAVMSQACLEIFF